MPESIQQKYTRVLKSFESLQNKLFALQELAAIQDLQKEYEIEQELAAIDELLKHNPYHDERGRFTSAHTATYVNLWGRPKEQGKVVGRGSDLPEPGKKPQNADEAHAAILKIGGRNLDKITELRAKGDALMKEGQKKGLAIWQQAIKAGLKTPEGQRLYDESKSTERKYVLEAQGHYGEANKMHQANMDEMHAALYVDEKGGGNVTLAKSRTRWESDRLAEIKAGMESFGKLTGVKAEVEARKTGAHRSFYDPSSKAINLSKYAPSSTTVHELGHWLEDHDPRIGRAAVDFLNRRTQGERDQWMGQGYGRNETAKKDQFISPYMGKQYFTLSGRQYATEIMSMGLELYHSDPYKLAKQDPEYFKFVYNTVRGNV